MKYFKVDTDGTPLSAPVDLVQIVRELGISTSTTADAEAYIFTQGYVALDASKIPDAPPAINGRCRIELDVPSRNPDGTYKREYTFTELTQDAVDKLVIINRKRRDLRLSYNCDTMNPMKWNSLTTAKQDEWTAYRQALLDVTNQPGWPANIAWPKLPTP